MGTRASLVVQNDDLSVKENYLHWDGYPSNVVPTLIGLSADGAEVCAIVASADHGWSSVTAAMDEKYPNGTNAQHADCFENLADLASWTYLLDEEGIHVYERSNGALEVIGTTPWGTSVEDAREQWKGT